LSPAHVTTSEIANPVVEAKPAVADVISAPMCFVFLPFSNDDQQFCVVPDVV
jgi:hypothetical protein